MASKTLDRRVGDLLVWDTHPSFCRGEGNIKHGTLAIDEESMLGMPVKKVSGNWQPVLDGDEANVEALVLSHEALELAANTVSPKKYLVLERGPAVINEDAIPTTDIEGDSYTVSTIVTALNALDIRVVQEPEKTSELS